MVTNRRPKAASVSRNAIDQANVLLQDLPEKPKDKLSLREAVDRLQEQIRATLAKGYSYEEVAQMLSDKGIEISASTLKNYLPSGKRANSATPAAKPRGRRGKAAQAADPKSSDSAFQTNGTGQTAPNEAEAPLNGSAPSLTLVETASPDPKTTKRRGRSTTAAKAATTRTKAEPEADKPKRGRRASAAKSTASTRTRRKQA